MVYAWLLLHVPLAGLFLSTLPARADPPANDSFSARIELTGLPVATTGSNADGGKEPGEPLYFFDGRGFFPTRRTVWWSWTAPTNGSVTAVVTMPETRPIMGVFTGSSFADLLQISTLSFNGTVNLDGTNYYSSEARFAASAGTTYAIAVDNQSPVLLAWDPSPDLDITGYRLYYGTASRTYVGEIDVGNVTGSSGYGLLDGLTNFLAVTAYNIRGVESDFSDEIFYPAAPASAQGGSSSFSLALSRPPRIDITSPAPGTRFVPGTDIVMEVAAEATDGSINRVEYFFNREYGPVDYTPLGAAPDTSFSLRWSDAPPGRYLLTAKAFDDLGGTTLSAPVPIVVGRPQNDDFADRIELTGVPVTTTGSTVAAGKEDGEPDLISGIPTHQTIWWSWTAPLDGSNTVVISLQNHEAVVGVFTGDSVTNLTEVSTFVPTEATFTNGVFVFTGEARFGATAGTQYAIAVDAGDGPFTLGLTTPPTVSIAAPSPGDDFFSGSDIFLEASPSDEDGYVSRVDFSYSSTDGRQGLIGTATDASFSLFWGAVPAGRYVLTATAVDSHAFLDACIELLHNAGMAEWLRPPPDLSPGDDPLWMEYHKDQQAYLRLLALWQTLAAIPSGELPRLPDGRTDWMSVAGAMFISARTERIAVTRSTTQPISASAASSLKPSSAGQGVSASKARFAPPSSPSPTRGEGEERAVTAQSSSVIKGMNGCSSFRISSRAHATMARVSDLAAPSSPINPGFASSRYQSQ
jgi:hypothetical protein